MGKEVDYQKLRLGQLVKADVEVTDREYGTPHVRLYFRSRVSGFSHHHDQGAKELSEVRFENGVILWGSFGHGVRLFRTSGSWGGGPAPLRPKNSSR